ncbi:MAG: Glycosyltransferase [candidate division CPR2 bacterium GW2011_GWC1_39_9]|uniref:Glycosyltransferase n=1 Tax=candidate division CPR2 bacterium GW2011_GWC2_39_10 TaxID=1618345 RepID=A0A0G0LP36_UNCC2|nr:MAG: Glycosyltransferase [candidate division CPR2 bacterium GW2011_GWC2_39_10]KKR34041.1 MAG: Glycosyltransferase [candidate division CPR2 bacterium GW2011_GWC1_39_9]
MKQKITVSVIVPVFNEESNLKVLTREIHRYLYPTSHEIIFVDDGSSDNSFNVLKNIRAKDINIKVLKLSRNFGQQAAILAGLSKSEGKAAIVMDADFQDPPQYLKDFVAKWQEGYNIVLGKRRKRKDTIFKKITAYIFYRTLNLIVKPRIEPDCGDFFLIDQKIVRQLSKVKTKHFFIRGYLSQIGFKKITVPIKREARKNGKSGYSLKKMLKLATDAVVNFSSFPVKIFYFFSLAVILAAAYFFYLAMALKQNNYYIFSFVALLSSIQFLGFAVLGEYIIRIYRDIRNSGHYLVDEEIGFDEKE